MTYTLFPIPENPSQKSTKQTSVDWLIEKMEEYSIETRGEKHVYLPADLYEALKAQARAMHREEVVEAYIEGHGTQPNWGNSEKYYNDTFTQ